MSATNPAFERMETLSLAGNVRFTSAERKALDALGPTIEGARPWRG